MSNAWQFGLNLPMVCFHNFSVLCFCYNQKFVTLRLQIITAFIYSLLEPMVRLVWRHYIPELFKYFRMMLWEKSTLTVLILLFRMQNVFNRFTYLCLLGTKLLRLWNMIYELCLLLLHHMVPMCQVIWVLLFFVEIHHYSFLIIKIPYFV